MGWIEIAKVERPRGIIRVFQDDETGRIKVETPVSMYYDQVLKLDLEKELRKDQMNAKYYEFFDDFGKAIKWIEERGFRNNSDFLFWRAETRYSVTLGIGFISPGRRFHASNHGSFALTLA